MTKLIWGASAARHYDFGLDRGVFYPPLGSAEVWNGLVAVDENVIDATIRTVYIDGTKQRQSLPPGNFSGTIKAFTYPESFGVYADGIGKVRLQQQPQNSFGLSYRVKTQTGYKLHLVYNATIAPSTQEHVYDVADLFSWDIETQSQDISGATASAHLYIDTTSANPASLASLEDMLYGTPTADPRLPLPDEIINLFETNTTLRITDNGDGTFTASGPDSVVSMINPTTFQISWASAVVIDNVSYSVSSL